ncbi:MAG TPA: SUMF1/EgtB/PvdO family nonheme iron enzyme [Candidatus Limnocylindria bacterium]|nr:SUMF1/EgtB/PvdO family nonheme iron enzyme [Candidatus Limnocylindria bacterium]
MSTARSITDTRQGLMARLTDARRQSDALFGVLSPEGLLERPIPERHRLIFYLGHLEAFDWNLLSRALEIPAFQPSLDQLFAFGIDPTDGGLPNEPASAWPPEAAVREYSRRAREAIDQGLESVDRSDPRLQNDVLIHVAIEHRLMHLETLAYLLHRMPYALKRAPKAADLTPPAGAMQAGRVRIPAGRATLGLPRNGGFGWDNEFEEHTVEVPGFGIDVTPITNGEYLEFMRAGGYENRELWSDAAWEWKAREGVSHPGFWVPRDGGFAYRGMFGEQLLALDWPVYVSHAEASAYARWAGRTLPTEAQFHRAACGTPAGEERRYPWGNEPPEPHHGNFDSQRWDPAPVGSYPAGRSAFGVADLLGNGWEWTASRFGPFPGFVPFPFYRGYSADFFDGKHFVMKGGSARTAACMVRRSFRNWFQPHYPYVYAGFRLVTM